MPVSKQIWKYPLNPGVNYIDMPVDSQILCVHEQHGVAAIWAQVNTQETQTVERCILVVATGESFKTEGQEYIGTIFLVGGGFVLHAYEVKKGYA
jgi:hypothetical protein